MLKFQKESLCGLWMNMVYVTHYLGIFLALCCSCWHLQVHPFLHGLAYHHSPAKYQTVVDWRCQQPQEDVSL